jgi:hypothetical protein
MSTDFEQRLRSEMEQVTVRPRPGLAGEAYRRYRARRRTARTVAVTGTAAVAAAGTAVGLGGTAGSGPSATPAETTAYVVSHVSSALAATDTIEYSYTVLRVASGSAPGERIASWDYGGYYGRERTMVYTAAGQRYSDEAQARVPGPRPSAPGTLTILDVDYRARTAAYEKFTIPSLYQKAHLPGYYAKATAVSPCDAQGIIIGFSLAGTSADSVASCVRGLLASGKATVTGRQRIDGVDTIKIVLVTGLPPRAPKPAWRQILWVNPSTYLPVQMATLPYSGDGYPYIHLRLAVGPLTEAVTEFRWLPPTPANLAQLNAPIPPGFRVSG